MSIHLDFGQNLTITILNWTNEEKQTAIVSGIFVGFGFSYPIAAGFDLNAPPTHHAI